MKHREINKELLERYHTGDCTEVESRLVEEWLQNEEAEVSFPEFQDLDKLELKSWLEMQDRVAPPNQMPDSGVKQLKTRRRFFVAASVFFVVGIIAFLGVVNFKSAPELITEKTEYGETRRVILPDGSSVWLNAGSEISYPAQFEDSIRLVSMKGEMYFEVAKNADQSFVIRSEKTLTQVIGTAFNLRDFSGEPQATLNVTEGKVSFSDRTTGEKLLATKGESVILMERQLRLVEIDPYALAWKSNVLSFNNLTMVQIAKELEKWFGIEVKVVNHDLLRQTYTGEFDDPKLKEVASSLGFALGFSYKYQDNILTLY
ncbi:ferric-dicitrate binding protein FerR (iron transport regulator) [Algoriphagus sp. 4150]|uniref:FecR family protein n=1 Tax=Algoriphagus sp. 4150 TaxID=2817756 RepID=UPI0028585D87|nr:FecR domain-containing protein [Algoriphagus sp. 4150]MDR7129553.1 ferric-dicitrate binding protein FerR (iron transport regulator) [Algoriphagus sp. 4150]